MWDKLEIIENKINDLLEKLSSLVKLCFLKVIYFLFPQIIFDKLNFAKDWVILKKMQFVQFVQLKLQIALEVFRTSKDKSFELAENLNRIPMKEKAITVAFTVKEFLLSTTLKKYIEYIKTFSAPYVGKMSNKLKKYASSQAFIAGASFSLMIVGLVAIYFTSNDIYKKEYPMRAPASVQEYDNRPEYRHFKQKTLKVLNVKVPVYVESVGEIKSITIDFSIRTSTRFAKLYLVEYEYKLKDYFFTAVEPIVSHFPIEKEGKEVLKEKIMEEIENFLHDNRVEGVIEEVNILYIVGS